MSTFSKDLLEYKIKFYSNIIKGMTSLLTVHAILFYIEYFAQYLMVRFCMSNTSNSNSVSTGASVVGMISGVEMLQNIVQLRNAIVHCQPERINEFCKQFTKIDFCNVDSGGDRLTTLGLLALDSVD